MAAQQRPDDDKERVVLVAKGILFSLAGAAVAAIYATRRLAPYCQAARVRMRTDASEELAGRAAAAVGMPADPVAGTATCPAAGPAGGPSTVQQRAWHIVAASVCGTSHQRRCAPCQDAFACASLPGGQLVIAVADGAGSAARAQQGAAFVVKQVMAEMAARLGTQPPAGAEEWRATMAAIYGQTRNALLAYVATAGGAPRDYAATLLVAVLDESRTVCALVGDCGAVAVGEDGSLLSLCTPQKGEYANTTNFLIEPEALKCLDVRVLDQPMQGIAVFTDGLLSLATVMAGNKPHAGFFLPLFSYVAAKRDEAAAQLELAAFLGSERVNARTDDDKTLVLAYRSAPGGDHAEPEVPAQQPEAAV